MTFVSGLLRLLFCATYVACIELCVVMCAVQNTELNAPHIQRPAPADQQDKRGMWYDGGHCGRWVEITLNEDCLGLGLTASEPPNICGVCYLSMLRVVLFEGRVLL